MPAKIRKPLLIGAFSGLTFVSVVVLVAYSNVTFLFNWVIREILNFIVALPALIFAALRMPQLLQNISFFIYWTLIGAFFGWLFGKQQKKYNLIACLSFIGLLILHFLANRR